jgi:hypothetical protein
MELRGNEVGPTYFWGRAAPMGAPDFFAAASDIVIDVRQLNTALPCACNGKAVDDVGARGVSQEMIDVRMAPTVVGARVSAGT